MSVLPEVGHTPPGAPPSPSHSPQPPHSRHHYHNSLRMALLCIAAAPAIFFLSGATAVIAAWLIDRFALTILQLNPTLYANLSVLEAVWLLENIVGFFYTWKNRTFAKRQYDYFRYSPDVRDCIIAEVKLLMHNAFMVVFAAFIIVGLIAAATPPPVTAAVQSAASVTALLAFVIVPGFLAWVSYRVDKANDRFRALVEQEIIEQAAQAARLADALADVAEREDVVTEREDAVSEREREGGGAPA